MTELNTDAGAAGSERSPLSVIAVKDQGHLSVSEAVRSLAQARKPNEQQQQAAEQRTDGAAHAAGQESTAQAGDATSQETPETHGGTENADPGAQEDNQALPPIEPPRSWTKEDKELFTSLPRETQERLAERERSRESDFLRRQNEAADKLKGLTVKEQAVGQARQQYEAALPLLLTTLQEQQAGEFADIKTLADVERLAREDMPRYVRWDIHKASNVVMPPPCG
jgi:hypothetical protein